MMMPLAHHQFADNWPNWEFVQQNEGESRVKQGVIAQINGQKVKLQLFVIAELNGQYKRL